MKNDSELAKKALEVSFEFSRYVLAHPEMDEKIPDNALITFEIEDDPELTAYNRSLAQRNKEAGQPVIVVHIKRILPSRLLEPEVRPVSV